MTVISSQGFINASTVEEKLVELQNETVITLPVWDADMQDEDGNNLYVLADGHHRFEAAKELGITVEYDVVRRDDGLTGELLLEAAWMDCDWYYINTGVTVW